MTVKLMTEHHLEFLSLKGGCTGLSNCHIVGNHVMARLYFVYASSGGSDKTAQIHRIV